MVQCMSQKTGTKRPHRVRGRTGPLCPGSSDLNFLGDLKGIVDLDTKMTHDL